MISFHNYQPRSYIFLRKTRSRACTKARVMPPTSARRDGREKTAGDFTRAGRGLTAARRFFLFNSVDRNNNKKTTNGRHSRARAVLLLLLRHVRRIEFLNTNQGINLELSMCACKPTFFFFGGGA